MFAAILAVLSLLGQVTVPILILGLHLSHLGPIIPGSLKEGNSLIYWLIKRLVVGPIPAGFDLNLHPIALAGWTGLFVTSLNLVPIGQLDGGHAAYTLFGPRIRWFNYVLIAILLALSFRFTGWLIWVGLLAFFGWHHAVPMDDITPLDGKHKALAILLLLLAALLFMPAPMTIVSP
jgi:membrane-associated protease RseP (regulator of RpoE activity)